MYSLYIANKNYSSWSLRPWLLMQQLAIPFEEKLVPFAIEGSNFEAFRHFSPTGKVPCLVDRDTVVWDSLAIAEYLAERHPGLWPEDAATRAWARCASAEMHSGFSTLRNYCPMCCGIRLRLHEIEPSLQRDIDRVSELWSEGLARFGGPFLAGARFTIIDAFYAPVAFRIQTYGLNLAAPAAEYAARLLTLAPMQRWYESALAEPWREPGHETEILSSGTLLADYRS